MSEEEFLKSEKAKMSFFDKAFDHYPQLHSTAKLAGLVKGLSPEREKIIRPSRAGKILTALLLLPAFAGWFTLFSLLLTQTLVPVVTGLLLFVSFIIGIIIWNAFLNPNYFFTIRLTNATLSVSKNLFQWQRISSTYIMWRREGRIRNSYLVIFTNDGRVHRYNLFKFRISDERLATLVEFYKLQKER